MSQSNEVKIFAFDEKNDRSISSWLGASILSCLNSFSQFCVDREEYSENGSYIIEKNALNINNILI